MMNTYLQSETQKEKKQLNFDEYQLETAKTAIYPEAGSGSILALSYLGLGASNEAGEVAGKIKKIIRDGDTPERREATLKEIGDTLWYLSQLANEMGESLELIAAANIGKLADRKERGVLTGDGDNR